MVMLKSSVECIVAERRKQIAMGFTVRHDSCINGERQLTYAARMLIQFGERGAFSIKASCPVSWDPERWEKMCRKPYEQRLIIAAALIAAEVDRLKFDAAVKELEATEISSPLDGCCFEPKCRVIEEGEEPFE